MLDEKDIRDWSGYGQEGVGHCNGHKTVGDLYGPRKSRVPETWYTERQILRRGSGNDQIGKRSPSRKTSVQWVDFSRRD